MLDHMTFAHEMDDGNSVYAATDTSSQRNGSKDDESMNLDNYDEPENDRESMDGNFSFTNDDVTNNLVESFDDNGSGDDDTMPLTDNVETIFNTSDENMVMVETIEYKPCFGTSKESSRVTPYESNEQASGKATVVEKNNEPTSTSVKIVKVSV